VSFSLILPFLRPIEKFILDEEISEVMVNASGRIFIERLGRLEEVQGVTLDRRHLEVAVKNIARRLGDDISEEKPILDSRLPDGSRVAAVFAPCSVGGTTLTIRKFHNRWFPVEDLVRMGSLEESIAKLLLAAIEERKNILISGGTGTGKTTLLNALASHIPDTERILLIEDTSEIQLSKPNLVRFEARGAREGLDEVTIRDLVRTSLRHRPDRILVGEVRGREAFDLLQALNTGHSGSLSTIHANSSTQALARFANCVLESGIDLPYAAIRGNIAESLNLVVQIERRHGERVVTEVLSVEGFDYRQDAYELKPILERRKDLGGSEVAEQGSLPPRLRPASARKPVQRRALGHSE
jgi:pilus assembly protein CpaF